MHQRPFMFKVPFFADRAKPVAERCRTDATTRLRLRYAPYYNVVEEADGLQHRRRRQADDHDVQQRVSRA